MLRGLLLGAAVYGGLAYATTVTSITSTTITSCSYKSGSGGVPPTPVPTHSTLKTTSTTFTRDTVTVPSTVIVTAPTTITVTQRTAISYTAADATITVPTSTRGVGVQKTVATATLAATVCANGAKPVTVTEYTGTYTPLSGQVTARPATYATEGFCTTGFTRIFVLSPTVTSGTVTSTVTATTTVTLPTTTSTSTIIFGTQTVYQTTVTMTYTSYTPTAVITTSTASSCPKTVTKTLDAACAPTNLISAINGEGLQSGRYADRTSVIYVSNAPWGGDPSACCQACLDNKCGGSMGDYGTCALLYTATEQGEPICDAFIFSFTSTPEVLPGSGLVVQHGCDRIEYQT